MQNIENWDSSMTQNGENGNYNSTANITYIQSIQKMSEQEKVGSELTVKWQETCQTSMMENFFENMGNLTWIIETKVNIWKNLSKFWNGPLCRNKSGAFPLFNFAAYWKSSNTEACAKNLSQILASNIDNRGRGTSLRIYVKSC